MSFLIKAYVMLYLRPQLERNPRGYIKDLWIAYNQTDIEKEGERILELIEALESISLPNLIKEYSERVSPFFQEHSVCELYEKDIENIFKRSGISRKILYPIIFQQYLKIWLKVILSNESEFLKKLIKIKIKAGKLPKNRDYFKDFIIVSYYPVLFRKLKNKSKIIKDLNNLGVFKITENYLNKMVSIYGYGYLGGEKENFVMRAGLLPPNPIPDGRSKKIIAIKASSVPKKKDLKKEDFLKYILAHDPIFILMAYSSGKFYPWENDFHIALID